MPWLIISLLGTFASNTNNLFLFPVSGRTYGPYGGNGGHYFEAIPPEPYTRGGKKIHCYLGWISGQSDRRLDGISFHWKCPKDPSHLYYEDQIYSTPFDVPTPSVYKSISSPANGCQDSKSLLIFSIALTFILRINQYVANICCSLYRWHCNPLIPFILCSSP